MVGHGARVAIPRGWLALTLPIAAAVCGASVDGAFGSAYARETASWAAQGVGQDFVNLWLVTPLLLAAAWLAARGSFRALLVWIGLLLYVVYSYLLYAFDVHFNRSFLAYIAALGFAFYACAGAVLALVRQDLTDAFPPQVPTRPVSALLVTVGVLFAAAWLSEIVPAVARGHPPASLQAVGLAVNPVHVLDLAFALPGLVIVGVLLRRRDSVGLLLAMPCATFLVVMGAAILSMSWAMAARGISDASNVPVPIVVTVLVAVPIAFQFLAAVRDPTSSAAAP